MTTKPDTKGGEPFAPATCSAVRAQDKSVRGLAVKCKLKAGQIIVEQSVCGIVFSFPAAVWPCEPAKQRAWVERLTPWWDMDATDWSPQAHRLRESCSKAINNLTRPAPKTANRRQTGNSLPKPQAERRAADTMTDTQPLAAATCSAADLPGCIRREIRRMQAEDARGGFDNANPECQEAVAFHRWAKRSTNEELSDAILTVIAHCVRERTCLAAKLAEAARRLRQNPKLSDGAK